LAQAYTPGLKRKKLYLVKKRRILPIPGKVLVKKGEKVTPTTIVATTMVPGDIQMMPMASMLDIDISTDTADAGGMGLEYQKSMIDKCMLKKEGEEVRANEIIARKKHVLSIFRKECRCPVNGKIEFISYTTGQLAIRERPKEQNLNAHIPGIVADVIPEQGVVIETPATYIQGIFGISGERHGELTVLSKSPEEILTADRIGSECTGKILVGGSLVQGDALKRAAEVGAKGIIVGGIECKDLRDFLGYEIGVAITGNEETALTLIITEGYGKMRMSQKTFELLEESDGKLACIDGTTHIRAGVIRPEIIIPRDDLEKYADSQDKEYLSGGIGPGAIVRIIREPYFGYIARVVSLPPELQTLETESKARVLEAELEDGRLVVVPRANVEMIEE